MFPVANNMMLSFGTFSNNYIYLWEKIGSLSPIIIIYNVKQTILTVVVNIEGIVGEGVPVGYSRRSVARITVVWYDKIAINFCIARNLLTLVKVISWKKRMNCMKLRLQITETFKINDWASHGTQLLWRIYFLDLSACGVGVIIRRRTLGKWI